jgi:alcohol dehydrogenase (NADP+)
MKWQTYEPKPFEETDIDIKITHCGICGSDLHTLRSGWGPTMYPCCVGHEIVGTAVKVGSKAERGIKVGDRVGVGAQCASCMKPDCEECANGLENHCQNANIGTYNGKFADGSKSYGEQYSIIILNEANQVFKAAMQTTGEVPRILCSRFQTPSLPT